MKEKENEKLKYSLDECKLLLKNSLEKEEANENEIANLKVVNKLNVDECSKAREKCKNMELELKDINNLNNNQLEEISNLKKEIINKEKEIKNLLKELSNLNNELRDKSSLINECEDQIKELKIDLILMN